MFSSRIQQSQHPILSPSEQLIRRGVEVHEVHSPFSSIDAIQGALPESEAQPLIRTVLSNEMAALRTESIVVVIRTFLAHAHVCVIQGKLDEAEEFVRQAYERLQKLEDKSIRSRIDNMRQLITRYRQGEYGRPRRSSSPLKHQSHRPPPIDVHKQRRNSQSDIPSPPLGTTDSLFDKLMANIRDCEGSASADLPFMQTTGMKDGWHPVPGHSSRTESEQIVSDAEGSTNSGQARSDLSRDDSVQRTPPSSDSSDEVAKLNRKLAYGSPSKKKPIAHAAVRGRVKFPSGGIDDYYHRNHQDYRYSYVIKDLQRQIPIDVNSAVDEWDNTSPNIFSDPWNNQSPKNSVRSTIDRLASISTPTEVEASRPSSSFEHGIISPIQRPSHPAPHMSIAATAFRLARRRSSVSNPAGVTSNASRRASNEEVEPGTTDGPALPKLLTSMQSNPHTDLSPTSPTERVRRLSVEETRVVPTRRPSLTLPLNINSAEKSAASTPSPLRQSFSASDIDFDNIKPTILSPTRDDVNTAQHHSPTITIRDHVLSRSSSRRSSPEISPKSTTSPSSSLPHISRIPIRKPTIVTNTTTTPKGLPSTGTPPTTSNSDKEMRKTEGFMRSTQAAQAKQKKSGAGGEGGKQS